MQGNITLFGKWNTRELTGFHIASQVVVDSHSLPGGSGVFPATEAVYEP